MTSLSGATAGTVTSAASCTAVLERLLFVRAMDGKSQL